jgi:hypothetical protein
MDMDRFALEKPLRIEFELAYSLLHEVLVFWGLEKVEVEDHGVSGARGAPEDVTPNYPRSAGVHVLHTGLAVVDASITTAWVGSHFEVLALQMSVGC